jgi:hypothetical protein
MPKYAPTAFDDLKRDRQGQCHHHADAWRCHQQPCPRIGARDCPQPLLEVIELTPEHRTESSADVVTPELDGRQQAP